MKVQVRFAGFIHSPLACERQPVFEAQVSEHENFMPHKLLMNQKQVQAAGLAIPNTELAKVRDIQHTNYNQCDENEPHCLVE